MAFRSALVAAVVLIAEPGVAQESEMLYSNRAWQVEVTRFDDGSYGCVAQVSSPDGGESFSIWTFQEGGVRLQFYSTQWEFGEGQTADLEVQIDRRGPWTLTAAELYLNSVLFDLPAGDDGARFVREVSNGQVLYLRNDSGKDVQSYSLAGSSASIKALIECEGAIAVGSPKNPFN
ncbi:MAG: hypothetical protein V4516_09420 [Pseudomonadota bacterium]